jgi:hypothetical protein
VLHVDLHQELSSFPKLPSRTTRLFEYSNLWQTPKKGLTMEEMNSPGDEDARITIPWLALSVMLSGFFSPLPREVAQHSFTNPDHCPLRGQTVAVLFPCQCYALALMIQYFGCGVGYV